MRDRGRRIVLIVAALTALVVGSAACVRRPTQAPPPSGAGVQTKKIRYGPFTVPNSNAPGQFANAWALPLVGMQVENGMVSKPVQNAEKPCQDCFLTQMKAGLEFADGSEATISRGLWLHHMVALASGNGKDDATCAGSALSLPHASVMSSPTNTERFFASGNERTVVDLTRTGSFGYRVNPADKFHLLVELMNLNTTDADVYLTVEYKFVNGNTAGYRPVKPVWLDVGNCWTSEVPAQAGRYQLNGTWTSTLTGTLVDGFGHLHDGGTNLTYDNGGQEFCDSRASYGTSPDYIEPAGGMGGMDHGGMDHGGASHISEMTKCPTGSTLHAGDVLRLTGNYDDSAHNEMSHNGRLHPVMALGILYYAP